MLYTESTNLGEIAFDKNIIGNIVKHTVEKYSGKVILSDAKGKPKKDDTGFLVCDIEDGIMDITVYIVLRFGTSIKGATEALIGDIREEIAMETGLEVSRVTIKLTGVLSKNFSKRDIEVQG